MTFRSSSLFICLTVGGGGGGGGVGVAIEDSQNS